MCKARFGFTKHPFAGKKLRILLTIPRLLHSNIGIYDCEEKSNEMPRMNRCANKSVWLRRESMTTQ
jgi:hypothetical protein